MKKTIKKFGKHIEIGLGLILHTIAKLFLG